METAIDSYLLDEAYDQILDISTNLYIEEQIEILLAIEFDIK